MALHQYKKISLCRKNAAVVLQVLQKILSLLTSGQEKKVCRYQSTVLMLQVSCVQTFQVIQLRKLHTIQGHSKDKTLIAFRIIRTAEPQILFSNIIICLRHNNRPCFESIKLLTLTHSSARLEHVSCPAQNFSAEQA